jgi:hypothetical protein
MQSTRKMRAAYEALQRLRPAKMDAAAVALNRRLRDLCVQLRATRSHGLGKRLLAKLVFETRYIAHRQELLETQQYVPLACTCGIDRVVLTASELPLDAIGKIPGYQMEEEQPLWKQSYRAATRIKGAGSIRKVSVEHKPAKPCYPPCRVVIEPRDSIRLQPLDLVSILERLSEPKIQLVEMAFDFPAESVVDTEFIENHAVFGKSKPHRVGQVPAYDSWGSRKGSKFVKSYFKGEIVAHRVEIESHALDLEKYGIIRVADFPKFAAVLPESQIFFGRIDHQALTDRLLSNAFSAEKVREIQHRVRNLEWNMCAALNYLRREVGLTNVRRILTGLDEMNGVVRDALEKWAAEWRVNVARVGRKP